MHGLLALMLLFDLSGTAQWDFELVREYFLKEHGVQIAPNVTFQNDGMLAHVNPEFAKRIRAMMAVYRQSLASESMPLRPSTGSLATRILMCGVICNMVSPTYRLYSRKMTARSSGEAPIRFARILDPLPDSTSSTQVTALVDAFGSSCREAARTSRNVTDSADSASGPSCSVSLFSFP
ncbi:MAG: hypothetical protein HY319_06395 [Armatimonadetes bacterium]|nr:hypothetical protein [Armatimonadota bacterium]